MKIFTRIATVMSVLCAVAAAVFMAAVFPGYSDAATVERGKDMKTDDDGHVLIALWKEYEAARSADLPQKEADALDMIMKEALGQNLTWDYYDAAVKWFNAVTSRNWKLYDRSRLRIMDDAGVLSDPVVDYSLMRSGLLDGAVDMEWFSANVLEKAAYLKRNCSRAFYAKDAALVPSMYCPAFIIPLISNDYEYLLWSVFQYGRGWRNSDVADAARKELENYLEGSYPSGTFLEYLSVLDGQGGADLKDCAGSGDGMSGDRLKDMLDERRTAFEDFAAEYDGKAVALYAMAQVLLDRKSFLDMGLAGMYGISSPESSDYVTLREDCGAFEKIRKSFRGYEKNVSECITSVSDLAEGLDAENVSLYTDEYTVGVVFRNVASAQLELLRDGMDGETVHTAGIENPYAGYYLPDTVKYKLPAIPDGDYVLVCRYGEEETALSYPVSSLSVAQRTVRDSGCGIYLAWQKSGRPVEKADIEILSKGDTVLTVEDFEFDGFTSLQDMLDEVSSEHDGALTIRCSFIDDEGLYRRSPDLFLPESGLKPLSSGSTAGQEPARRLAARIFKDRGAFNPGDSAQFKVVLYSYSGVSDCAVQAGRDIKVWLTDPDGRTVSEMTLKTNGFGSADGSFLLPETIKGGTYYISVNVSGSYGFIARSALTVDEFVLPTYTMEFENGKDVWFSGDTVVVRGRLSSYSGHPVSSARIEYTVESYVSGASPLRGETEAGDDGSFEIRFKAWTPDGDRDRLYFCYPSVKVTDLTGETYEWSAGPVYVNPGMTVFTHLRNEAEGSVDMLPGAAGDGDVALMSCDTAIISFSLTSSLPECPVEYEIIHNGLVKKGADFRKGFGVSGRMANFLDNDPDRIGLAFSILMSLPGVPIIYYGDEIGARNNFKNAKEIEQERKARQKKSKTKSKLLSYFDSRDIHRGNIPYKLFYGSAKDYYEFNSKVYKKVKNLIQLRKELPVMSRGQFILLNTKDPANFAYIRKDKDKQILVVNNLSDKKLVAEITLPVEIILKNNGHIRVLKNLINDDNVRVNLSLKNKTMHLRVKPYDALWLEL